MRRKHKDGAGKKPRNRRNREETGTYRVLFECVLKRTLHVLVSGFLLPVPDQDLSGKEDKPSDMPMSLKKKPLFRRKDGKEPQIVALSVCIS